MKLKLPKELSNYSIHHLFEFSKNKVLSIPKKFACILVILKHESIP